MNDQEHLMAEIEAQSNLVRRLKTDRTDKATLVKEVNKLLTLQRQVKRYPEDERERLNRMIGGYLSRFAELLEICEKNNVYQFRATRPKHMDNDEYNAFIDRLKIDYPTISCDDNNIFWET